MVIIVITVGKYVIGHAIIGNNVVVSGGWCMNNDLIIRIWVKIIMRIVCYLLVSRS